MKFAILLLASVASAAPTNELVVTTNFYPDNLIIYTSDHDIVDIVVPQNLINFPDRTWNTYDAKNPVIFFVVADIKDDKKDYKGLYVSIPLLRVATKLLDNGQCVTYTKGTNLYFGAKDGIYKYNPDNKNATKYGDVTDSVIKMAVDEKNARVYYITEDYVLYKYNENEIASSKVDAVQDARDIVFDFDGNMFYYDGKKEIYSYNGERVVKIEGLPTNPIQADLIRSSAVVYRSVLAVVNGRSYVINANGTSERIPVSFQAKPTAYAPDNFIVQYYAYNKKIYEYDLDALMSGNSIEELSRFLEDKKDQINALKTTHTTPEAQTPRPILCSYTTKGCFCKLAVFGPDSCRLTGKNGQ